MNIDIADGVVRLAIEAWFGACCLMALVWLAVSIHLAGKE
jgi:hypothetical protein